MSAGPVYPYRDRRQDHRFFKPTGESYGFFSYDATIGDLVWNLHPDLKYLDTSSYPRPDTAPRATFGQYGPIVYLTKAELRALAKPQEEPPCARRSER